MIDVPETLMTDWYDPGDHTGWAWIEVSAEVYHDGRPLVDCIVDWDAGQWQDEEPVMAWRMMNMSLEYKQSAHGCEGFKLRKFSKDETLLSPVRVRAMYIYAMYHAFERPRVFQQQASLAMTTLTDKRQKRAGLWIPGEDHARDAIKHCWTFLERARKNKRMAQAAWEVTR